jgi:N-acetyl-anhydromuramyl-L-alanine amidase AmpD
MTFADMRELKNDRWVVGEDPRAKDVRLGVIHYTAGSSLLGDVRYMESVDKDDGKSASYNAIIGDGTAIELLDPKLYRAWHAGKSEYLGVRNVNGISVGVAISNRGFSARKTEFHSMQAPMPGTGTMAWWEPYYEDDILTLVEVCYYYEQRLKRVLPWVGHQEVSPGRKSDPGPMFPWAKFHELMAYKRVGLKPPKKEPPSDIDKVMKKLTALQKEVNNSFHTAHGRVLHSMVENAVAWSVYMKASK